jgi:LAS superfamily LD-carboxypeptidase LdcB
MADLRGLQPWLYPWALYLLELATHAGRRFVVTSVRRSYLQQARLYRDYVAKLAAGEPTLPALPPGYSLHQVGRAFDVDTDQETARELGAIWVSWGGRWDASDYVHYEA